MFTFARTATWWRLCGRTNGPWPFFPQTLRPRWGRRRGRSLVARRRLPSQRLYLHTTRVWGGWILLTSMHLTTTLAVPQCAGGGTSVGGCSRPLWWMHSSFGRSVRGQHRPRKACVTWTFVWLFFAPCARATWAENWDQRKLWPRQV